MSTNELKNLLKELESSKNNNYGVYTYKSRDQLEQDNNEARIIREELAERAYDKKHRKR